jgi:hypothetical protein
MANPEHIEILKQGVEVWNRWRAENPKIVPDLSGVDLAFTDLSYANLSLADLNSANLSSASLLSANLRKVYFNGTILERITIAFTVFGELRAESSDQDDLRKEDAGVHCQTWTQYLGLGNVLTALPIVGKGASRRPTGVG